MPAKYFMVYLRNDFFFQLEKSNINFYKYLPMADRLSIFMITYL